METTYRSVEKARTTLITALEKEREDIRNEGIEQGIEQGEQARNREIVRTMHVKGSGLTIIADMIGLTIEQVNELLADGNGAAVA